jgi:hypothetical protein
LSFPKFKSLILDKRPARSEEMLEMN